MADDRPHSDPRGFARGPKRFFSNGFISLVESYCDYLSLFYGEWKDFKLKYIGTGTKSWRKFRKKMEKELGIDLITGEPKEGIVE